MPDVNPARNIRIASTFGTDLYRVDARTESHHGQTDSSDCQKHCTGACVQNLVWNASIRW